MMRQLIEQCLRRSAIGSSPVDQMAVELRSTSQQEWFIAPFIRLVSHGWKDNHLSRVVKCCFASTDAWITARSSSPHCKTNWERTARTLLLSTWHTKDGAPIFCRV